MSAEFDCREHEGVSYVRVSGVIDDSFDAKTFIDGISGTRVVLNIAKLRGIEDGGLRLWRRALQHISDRSEEVLLWDCPSDVTEQFSETPSLLGNARVASYRVPYRCTSCKKDIAVRLDAATLNPDDVSGSLCRGCDGKLRVQRNPEVLVDLRKHAAVENAALRMKNLVTAMERRFDDSDFLEVHTASDLPDAFESTTSVLPVGTGESAIEELSPVQRSQESSPARPKDATRPSRPQPRLEPRPASNSGVARRPPNLDSVPEPHLVGERQLPLTPRAPRRTETLPVMPLVAVGVAGLVVGFVLGFASTGGGLPETPVLEFTVNLNDGDFARAEAVLEASRDELPEILVELYRQELSRARAEAAEVYRRQAIQAFKEQRYDEAASYAQEALVIEDPEGKMLYLLADALRSSGRRNEALPHYRAFFEKFPEDELADDAMYWRAEALVGLGQFDEAKDLLERILSLTRSNYKRAAGRLLLELP